MITLLRSPWKITGHWDLKLAGNKGGVCSIAYVPGLARPVP